MKKKRLHKIGKSADGSNFTVWLPEDGVWGRRNQKTIETPDGKKMSVRAAAIHWGINTRTLSHRIRIGLPRDQWFFKGKLARRRPPSKTAYPAGERNGRILKRIKGVDKQLAAQHRPVNPRRPTTAAKAKRKRNKYV